jgi:hypothetical protein
MRRHVDAVGQERHGAIEQAAGNLDRHEDRRDQGREARPLQGAIMAMAKKDVPRRPDAMVVGIGLVIVMLMTVMVMPVMIMMGVICVIVGMGMRHGDSLARSP